MLRMSPVTGLLLIVSALPSAAQNAVPLAETVPSITVEGSAEREVKPDIATLTIGATADQPTAERAASDSAQSAQRIVAAARAAGLGDADIKTSDFRLSAVTDTHGKISSFQASNRITLRIRDLSKVGALVSQMVTSGANTIEGVAFELENPQVVLNQLRGEASIDARSKADIYANAAGVKLGRILRIAPDAAGTPTPTPRTYKLRMATAASPVPPVESGSEALRSTVQITWELVP